MKKNSNFPPEHYEVIIVGAGVVGTAFMYVLSNYTNVKKIKIIEDKRDVAQVNSNYRSNSQTLHTGDIETNTSIEKAKVHKEAGRLMATFMEKNCQGKEIFVKGQKMCLAVGGEEVSKLSERYELVKNLYPKLKKIGRDEIADLEPNVVKGRDPNQEILALATEGYTVNYYKLSQQFLVESAMSGKEIDLAFSESVISIEQKVGAYLVTTNKGSYSANAVAVMAGGNSLVFAKSLGLGKHLGLLPVAGNFYYSGIPDLLNGKVYTMQKPEIPFAEIHGDPEVSNQSVIRFGPTTNVIPQLERRGGFKSFINFIRASVWSPKGIATLFKVISNKTIFGFVLENILFQVPWIGKYFFLQHVKKIIPTMRYMDLFFAEGVGGVRNQVANTLTGKLEMGVVEIEGEKIIFNITPSPGASASLYNALKDAKKIVGMLGEDYFFDHDAWDMNYNIQEHEKIGQRKIATV